MELWNETFFGRNGMAENCQYELWKIIFHSIAYHALLLSALFCRWKYRVLFRQ